MSSGSTGRPKPVIKTNRNLIALANVLQTDELDNYKSGDIVISTFFCHVCGIRTLVQTISGGATVALSSDMEWRENLLAKIEKYGISSAFLVPSELYFMVKRDDIVSKYDITSLQDIQYGGSNLSEAIYYECIKKFNFKYFRNSKHFVNNICQK